MGIGSRHGVGFAAHLEPDAVLAGARTHECRPGELSRGLSQPGAVPDVVRANAMRAACILAIVQGDYGEGERWARQCVALYRGVGDDAGLAWALRMLGVGVAGQGNLTEATHVCSESLALIERVGDVERLATGLNVLGRIALLTGDYAVAQQRFERAGMVRNGPQLARSPVYYHESGDSEHSTGTIARGKRPVDQAMDTALSTGDHESVFFARLQLSHLEVAEGKNRRAIAHFEAVLAYFSTEEIQERRPNADRDCVYRCLPYPQSAATLLGAAAGLIERARISCHPTFARRSTRPPSALDGRWATGCSTRHGAVARQ